MSHIIYTSYTVILYFRFWAVNNTQMLGARVGIYMAPEVANCQSTLAICRRASKSLCSLKGSIAKQLFSIGIDSL